MANDDVPTWRSRVGRMRRDPRPYKPLMLHAILNLLDSGRDPRTLRVRACVDEFGAIVRRLAGSLPPDIAVVAPSAHMPLWHLSQASPVPFLRLDHSIVADREHRTGSNNELLSIAQTLAIDGPIADELATPEGRLAARVALAEVFDDDPKLPPIALMQEIDPIWSELADAETLLRARESAEFTAIEAEPIRRTQSPARLARDRALRRIVLSLYEYRCAFCGRCVRLGGRIEAECAHIRPRGESGVDDARNALSLCRNHHWAFDNFLWTLSDDLVVELAVERADANDDLKSLADERPGRLAKPTRAAAHPHPHVLQWHRENFHARRHRAVE